MNSSEIPNSSYTTRIETADDINHGMARFEYCLEAVIYRFEDGYVLCPPCCGQGRGDARSVWRFGRRRWREMAEKLMPCPFCGGKAELIIAPGYFKPKSGWLVKCRNGCCNQMPYRSDQGAIEAWNRRVKDGG